MSDDNSELTSVKAEDIPNDLSRAIKIQLESSHAAITLIHQTPAPNGLFCDQHKKAQIGNSYICFQSKQGSNDPWRTGQIKYMFQREETLYFAVQRSHSYSGVDFLKDFWKDGFEAKAVGEGFRSSLELVPSASILGHVARWKIAPGLVGVVSLNKVGFIYAALSQINLIISRNKHLIFLLTF